ncbi:7 transmembrane sweet-taste receptor of 3 GCPR-domain-containing protein [Polychytrium aggregatum]|uniref:7 transmembrane sweet-taste receptor of 3 GCPR-domain-containing protein n=1 Tax=Polychytrium aggregatum TaxID=110093 RepID=UPI0022FEA0E1|nr:7 transmembrane sweet-taste receptor of 3 GCPR-domain-containing protein [Polychytrium aggregatum]KAI9192922.1 7 transmembrane sweet-taste receptor of 3 GCPR-domain-containing protein [Polychytrium aggregatum]
MTIYSLCGPESIGPFSTTTLTDKSSYSTFFRTIPNDNLQAPAILAFVRSRGWSNILLMIAGCGDEPVTSLRRACDQWQRYMAAARHIAFVVMARCTLTYIDMQITVQAIGTYNAPITAQGDGISNHCLCRVDTDLILYLERAAIYDFVGPRYTYIGSDATYSISNTLTSVTPYNTTANMQLASGLVSIMPQEVGTTLNTRAQSIYNRFVAAHGNIAPRPGMFFTYDCVLGMAYAIKQLLANGNTTVAAIASRSFPMAVTSVLTPFVGSTGQVTFSAGERIGNYIVGNYIFNASAMSLVSVVSQNLSVTDIQPVIYPSGLTVPSTDHIVLPEVYIAYTDPAPIVLIIIYMIAMSPPFLQIISLGLVLLWLTVFGFTGKMSAVSCQLQNWFGWLGFSIITGSQLVKAYRIWVIFDNQKLKMILLSNVTLFTYTAVIVAVNLILLIVWAILDPPVPVLITVNEAYQYYDCSSSRFSGFILSRAIVAYNITLQFAVLLFAYKTQNVDSVYRESKWMTYTSLFNILCGAIAFIVIWTGNGTLSSNFFLKSILMLLAIFLNLYCHVGRLILTSSTVWGKHMENDHEGSAVTGKTTHSRTDTFVDVVVKEEGNLFSTWEARRLIISNDQTNVSIDHPESPKKKVAIERPGICARIRNCSIEDAPGDQLIFSTGHGGRTYVIEFQTSEDKEKLLCLQELATYRLKNSKSIKRTVEA